MCTYVSECGIIAFVGSVKMLQSQFLFSLRTTQIHKRSMYNENLLQKRPKMNKLNAIKTYVEHNQYKECELDVESEKKAKR